MSSKHKHGMLYIRRLKPSDKCDSWMISIQVAAKQLICEKFGRKPPMVLMRRGERGILNVGYSRRELENSLYSRHPNFKALARAWRQKEGKA